MTREQLANEDDDGVVRKHLRGAPDDEGTIEDMFATGDDEREQPARKHAYNRRSDLQLK